MAIEQTLSIIKPDAVAANRIGDILARFEQAGLTIVAARMARLTPAQVSEFYAVHRERPFFPILVDFMASGPVMIQVLEGDDAVRKNRDLMGATNPRKAAPGTIRYDISRDVPEAEMHRNAVHGSDSAENARAEIAFFFKPGELSPRR
jgi:nucleoside-diphosphate kinase